MQQLCMKFEMSGFLHDGRQYVFVGGAYFQHDCYANCRFALLRNANKHDLWTLHITSVRDIAQTEACTILWHKTACANTKVRQRWMRASFGYLCLCESCLGMREKCTRDWIAENEPGTCLEDMCATCGVDRKRTNVAKFPCCARCKRVVYCSRLCQVEHWKDEHKFRCKSKE